MREHLANVGWGVLDYAAYPIGMLLVAPIVLRNMGAAQYGIWSVATAAVSMGSIVAAGFGDANIQHVASRRGMGRPDLLLRTVRCMISINLVLGTAVAILTWVFAPYVARHVVPSDAALQTGCLWSLRLACILIWLRTLESVCISTQRAFERYGPAVRTSLIARLVSLVAAAALTYFTHNVAALLGAAVVANVIGTSLQFVQLRRLLDAGSLTPILDRAAIKALLVFGVFSWMQALSGIVFSQADRLFLGLSTGAVAVASYALCTQMAQPIYGVAASGLHFLFPHLARSRVSRAPAELRRVVLTAFVGNLLMVAAAAVALGIFGQDILHVWAGKEIARRAFRVLPTIIVGSALLGVNVTATYSLYALGRVRVVTWLNLAGGVAMLLLMVYLAPRFGAYGLAIARLSYGTITLFLYVPLIRELRGGHPAASVMAANPVCEEI
ncbi:MAG: oligosaccharide flippase family protein [Acidobacteriaceae bacterium]